MMTLSSSDLVRKLSERFGRTEKIPIGDFFDVWEEAIEESTVILDGFIVEV